MFFLVVEFKFFVIDILLYKLFSFYTYVQCMNVKIGINLYSCSEFFVVYSEQYRVDVPDDVGLCVCAHYCCYLRVCLRACVCVCACVSLLVNYDMILVSLQDGLLLVAAATEEALFCRVGISKGSRRNLQGLALESPNVCANSSTSSEMVILKTMR